MTYVYQWESADIWYYFWQSWLGTMARWVLPLLIPSKHIVLHAYVASTILVYIACNNDIALWRRN